MTKQATCATIVAALMLSAAPHAAIVVDPDGKPVRRGTRRQDMVIGDVRDGACKALPPNRVVPFKLAPEAKLVDAVAWLSPIICKQFVVRDPTLVKDKRLTLVAPRRVTPDEAYRLIVGALDAVGLRVESSGSVLSIEKGTTVPRSAVAEPVVTALLRWRDIPPKEQARLQKEWLFERRQGESGDAIDLIPDSVVITDLRSNVERILGCPIK